MKDIMLVALGTVVAILVGCAFMTQASQFKWVEEPIAIPDFGRVQLGDYTYPLKGYMDRDAHCFEIDFQGTAHAMPPTYTPATCQWETNTQIMMLIVLMMIVEVASVGLLLMLFGD